MNALFKCAAIFIVSHWGWLEMWVPLFFVVQPLLRVIELDTTRQQLPLSPYPAPAAVLNALHTWAHLIIIALLGSCHSLVTRTEAKFLRVAKSIKPAGLESELCLALACSCCVLSPARDLHTLSCSACLLWFAAAAFPSQVDLIFVGHMAIGMGKDHPLLVSS